MTATIPFKDKGDILIYLLLYVANLDGNTSAEELQQIINIDDTESFVRIRNEFNKDNDFQALSKIKKYKNMLFEAGDTEESVINSITKLLKSDSHYTQLEKHYVHSLHQILK